jgi:hypothetical protein
MKIVLFFIMVVLISSCGLSKEVKEDTIMIADKVYLKCDNIDFEDIDKIIESREIRTCCVVKISK